MNQFMMWWDNNKKTTLTSKIEHAVEYYHKKYGNKPTLCYVNPAVLKKEITIDNLKVRPYRPVLLGHLWIGIEENE